MRRAGRHSPRAAMMVWISSSLMPTMASPRFSAKRAAAIVQATANWQDADLLARLSENLGEAMVGINEDEIQTIMAARGE